MERRRSLIPLLLEGRLTLLAIPVALVVLLIPPETGLGIELCAFKRITGAPCPGCGVTRSCANLVRGNVRRSIEYHPLGIVFAPVLFGLVAFSLLPGAVRRAGAERLGRCDRLLRWATIVFWTVFFLYGLTRWVLVMSDLMTFPPPP